MIALISALFLTFSSYASDKIVVRCEPAEMQPWPQNAYVNIVENKDSLEMQVSSGYYGVDMNDKYPVTMQEKGKTLIFQGENASLEIPTRKSAKLTTPYVIQLVKCEILN